MHKGLAVPSQRQMSEGAILSFSAQGPKASKTPVFEASLRISLLRLRCQQTQMQKDA